ncbi:YHS/TRASH domain protein OS=Geobacter bemidjiensis (strain Bem / ATCC BAA-1014 / DSM 16622) GN=Gbem_2144 PE=4 SV=1 [Gemmata massiliana]|uniref:YHS/TRASH domain protein n=1 Tax=Gemmata massiliana TaxID=1210884 RepID=A0A6P2D7J5_9BACT|nr:hypothetical protein [Gemmata massiliana]VTR97119.1 YHS/TRASH domain protein OS=Geobacter bemidjiensis (strain Bem / ATCC BAA-1014 / DSM 16622) GN=Gbem_2144 PE=4 SV=1 [Gemmata massiliana]
MSDINELEARIEGTFTAVKDKLKAQQQRELQNYLDRQKLFHEYEKVQTQVVEIAKPRLQALARRSGNRVSVTPLVTETRRAARFDFKSAKAYITLTVSVAPDQEIKNAVVEFDLRIVPVLWKFDRHADFNVPIAAPDFPALTKWLDDRIVAFVELYVQMHESEIYDKAEFVEDPVAKVSFPKFAAGASLEVGGQTHFFIDDTTRATFAQQNGIAVK